MDHRNRQQQTQTDAMLAEWDASITPALADRLASLPERRAFLGGVLKSVAILGSLPLWAVLPACDRQAIERRLVQQDPWRTFAAVQQQLLPADGNGPSASDIHAAAYLKFVLEAPDTDAADKSFLLDGIKWLNDLSKLHTDKVFAALGQQAQDKILHRIAASRAGERWLSSLILYVLEALLSDPVYGGNPDGIGWRWLEYQPGFPRPPKHKRYTELL